MYFVFHPKYVTERSFNWYMKSGQAKANLPYPQAKTMADPPVPRDMYCAIICPVLGGVLFKDAEDLTDDRILLTVLALRAYGYDHHGSCPSALSELVPRYMTSVPVDPFSDGSAPLIYRKTTNSYTLYSIGPDRVDNGGKPINHRSIDGKVSHRYFSSDNKGDVVAWGQLGLIISRRKLCFA